MAAAEAVPSAAAAKRAASSSAAAQHSSEGANACAAHTQAAGHKALDGLDGGPEELSPYSSEGLLCREAHVHGCVTPYHYRNNK